MPKLKLPAHVAVKDLQLGDVIDLEFADSHFPTAMVFYIDQDVVKMRRPYMAHADFSMSGGKPGASQVIVYMGHEDVTYLKSDTRPMRLVSRESEGAIR